MSAWQLCLWTLPAAHRQPNFSLQHTACPPPWLSTHQRAHFTYLFNGFPVTGRTAFSQGSSQPRASSPTVCSKMSPGVCHAPKIRLLWSEPPHLMAICTWRYSISHPPGNFCPCSGASAFLKFNFSVACRSAKDSILHWCTHFDTGALSKLPYEVSTPSPKQGKMTGKRLNFYEQIFKYVQIFLLPSCIIGVFERSLTPAV